MSKTVAIHQPNFFPWLGFFDKYARADIFILLDIVQLQKTGGSWTNRVKIVVNGNPSWITVPIERSYSGTIKIKDVKINDKNDWRNKILKTIKNNYSKAPFFNEVYPEIEELINNNNAMLADNNISAISALSTRIGLGDNNYILGSSLNINSKSTQMLIEMTKAVNGTAYICGAGASGYQNDEEFERAGLKIIYQNFQHPIYSQVNSDIFIPGLSIIDALMNVGFSDLKTLLKG
jgi:hypothetical protein